MMNEALQRNLSVDERMHMSMTFGAAEVREMIDDVGGERYEAGLERGYDEAVDEASEIDLAELSSDPERLEVLHQMILDDMPKMEARDL